MVLIGGGSQIKRSRFPSKEAEVNLSDHTNWQNSNATGQIAGLSDLSDLKTRAKPFA